MKITIVTVTYNSAATLADTLRSVAVQSHPDIEHLVIDGASTDGTLALLTAARGGHIPVVHSEPDCGIYDAMNKGIARATGDFIGFLNSDDTFADAEAVARIVRAASACSVDAVYGDLIYVERERPSRAVRYWKSGPFRPERLRFGWMPPHPTLYVRRSRLAELGPFRSDFRIAADYEFVLRYLGRPGVEVAYVPEVLVKMRVGGASNRSPSALLQKSQEDLRALRQNRIGGVPTLICKNLRKVPQFFLRPRASTDRL